MINLHSIKKNMEPFEWYSIPNALDVQSKKILIDSFPSDNFEPCIKNYGDKPYNMSVLRIYKQNTYNNSKLIYNQSWIKFIQYIISNGYINLLSERLNSNLNQYTLEVNLWKYPNGGFLAPHLDKDQKYLSQLFYFNQEWHASWGGALRLLYSNVIDDVSYEIFPDTDESIILTQSDKSWHAVTKQVAPVSTNRNVLQLIFWINHA